MLREALHPLPLSALGLLVLSHASCARQHRAPAVIRGLGLQGITAFGLSDVEFCFEKLEAAMPQFLQAMPPLADADVSVWPALQSCQQCRQAHDAHQRELPLKMYSALHGLQVGHCVERHCSRCGSYFMGIWMYNRRAGSQGLVENLRMVQSPEDAQAFVMFTGLQSQHAVGMHTSELKRATGILHHARGSFRAVADIMIEESPSLEAEYGHLAERVVKRLWIPFELSRFLSTATAFALDWTAWHDAVAGTADHWLFNHRDMIREQFVDKWLLKHVAACAQCSKSFGFGLDGKRGMKRFVCAALDRTPVYSQPLSAWVHQPCTNAPRKGGLFCKEHDVEECEPLAGTVVQTHRRSEHGKIEYRLSCMDEAGHECTRWVPQEDVPRAALRTYALTALPEPASTSRSAKKQRRSTVDKATPSDMDILSEHQEDQGACKIDKSAADLPKKWARRRIGGIIAAVSGCRVFLDWQEHHGGEGLGEVYHLLAKCINGIQEGKERDGVGRLPDVVFYDNACALQRFARNPLRAHSNSVTETISKLHYMIDHWHVTNHRACLQNPADAESLDPRSTFNRIFRTVVDTEACEQAFSFLDRVSYVGLNMGPGMFHAYIYLIMDRENEKVVRRRS